MTLRWHIPAWRFISNCSEGMTTYPLGLMVSAIFTVLKPLVDAHRYELQHQVWIRHGIVLRSWFSITSWTQVPLNLPDSASTTTSFITGAVKQCYDNIPLSRPDGLDVATEAYILEGLSAASHSSFLWIWMVLLPGKHASRRLNFPAGVRWPPGFMLMWTQLLKLQYTTMTVTVIRTGRFLVVQAIGIPIGNPPCWPLWTRACSSNRCCSRLISEAPNTTCPTVCFGYTAHISIRKWPHGYLLIRNHIICHMLLQWLYSYMYIYLYMYTRHVQLGMCLLASLS